MLCVTAMAHRKIFVNLRLALSCDSREEVTRMCETAFASGGRAYRAPQDHGFMFAWAFEDPGGHVWEPFWMDPAHVQG